MLNRIYKMASAANREEAKKQGFYDGRFKSKVVPDKKKIQHRQLRKQKTIIINNERY
jgi:hypothetical protein